MMSAAMLPLLANLASRAILPDLAAPTPSRLLSTPPRTVRAVVAYSPMPSVGSEIRALLSDFASAKGIDLTTHELALKNLDLTPDIIPLVAVARLCEITGCIEGQAIKFQLFAKSWYSRLEEKRSHR